MRRLVTVEGMKYAGVLAATTVIAGGAAFAAVEKDQGLSSWDGIWWAVTTVTTVGYGDVYPETTSGRVMAMTIMAVGIGFVALLTAFVADRFIRKEVVEEVEEREDQILAKLDARTRTEAAIIARDRGLPTRATDHGLPATTPPGEEYVILDLPEATSRERLAEIAGEEPLPESRAAERLELRIVLAEIHLTHDAGRQAGHREAGVFKRVLHLGSPEMTKPASGGFWGE